MKIKKFVLLAAAVTMCLGTAVYAADKQQAAPVDETHMTFVSKGASRLMPGENVVDKGVATKVAALPSINVGSGTTILGPAEVTQAQMVQYIKMHSSHPKLNCSVEQIVAYYYDEAGNEGIRPDVALCQALLETDFFRYGGDVVPAQNNYCGLGTPGNGDRGEYFPTPQIGVRAHIQHLLAYTLTREPKRPLVDPRYNVLRQKYPRYFGQIPYWTGLNGKWALPGTHYAQTILRFWQEAKSI